MPSEPFFAGEYVTVALTRTIENTSNEPMAHAYAWSFWIKAASASLNLTYVTRYSIRLGTEVWVQPYGAYAGDLNDDGWSDLFIPCERTDDVRIFMNNGAGLYPGGFTSKKPANMNGPSPNEAGDLNNDGNIDVIVTNFESDRIIVMFGDGAGGFPTNVGLVANATQNRAAGVLDLNGDGWDDIVTASRAGDVTSIFMNNTLHRVDTEAGVKRPSLAVADANNDGIMDVFLGNYNLPRDITVLLEPGNGGRWRRPVPTSGQL